MRVFFCLKLKFFLLAIKNTLRKKVIEIFKKICYNYNRIKEKGEKKIKMAGKLYDEKSIESLSPLEFTRLRPGVYAGDCTYSTQLLVEIISNAVDEFRAGHGNLIKVKIDKDIVTVEDNGQGFIPNCKRDEGKTVLEAAFSVLNTSGKYREDGSYEGTSLGSFGIGSKITNFLS